MYYLSFSLSSSDSARKYEARHLQAHAERSDLAQVKGGPVCAGREVLAEDGRQLHCPDDHSHNYDTTANCLIICNVFSRVETDSNLNGKLAYTVRHLLNHEICPR